MDVLKINDDDDDDDDVHVGQILFNCHIFIIYHIIYISSSYIFVDCCDDCRILLSFHSRDGRRKEMNMVGRSMTVDILLSSVVNIGTGEHSRWIVGRGVTSNSTFGKPAQSTDLLSSSFKEFIFELKLIELGQSKCLMC